MQVVGFQNELPLVIRFASGAAARIGILGCSLGQKNHNPIVVWFAVERYDARNRSIFRSAAATAASDGDKCAEGQTDQPHDWWFPCESGLLRQDIAFAAFDGSHGAKEGQVGVVANSSDR